MDVFKIGFDIHTPLFLRYLPKLAAAWNMPCDTASEKQDILDRVYETEAFRKHGSHPKLANWFSWNQTAHDQIPDFFAL